MTPRVEEYLHEQPDVVAAQLRDLPPEVARVADAAGSAHRVVLVGSGTSHHASRAALGAFPPGTAALIPTEALHYPGPSAPGPGTLVIGVSQSGRSTGTLQALAVARAAGARTVLVAGEPVAGVDVDAMLDVGCGPEDVGAKTKGYTATVVALAMLGRALTGAPVADDLCDLPAAMGRVLLAARGTVGALVARRAPASLSIVSYGPHFATALEGALKVVETARIPVEVSDVEEFLHGPHLRLTQESVVAVVGGPGPMTARAGDLVAVVLELGGRVLDVRTPAGDLSEPGHARWARVPLPAELSTQASVIAAALPLQLLAVELTSTRGLTPEDDPFPWFHDRLGTKRPHPATAAS